MNRIDWLRQRMQELGVEPKRSLGQNFLIGDSVIYKIIAEVESLRAPYVVEVGPGLGSLTEDLIRIKTPRVLIELDRHIAEYWRGRGERVVEADALQLNWSELELPPDAVLVSNLPYQISSRLVVGFSTDVKPIRRMVLMFQREVADRLTAKPRTKDYGFLSVVGQTFWKMRKVTDASASDFYPPPKVTSRVLRFDRIDVDYGQDFVEFVKLSFVNRRKFLVKNFKSREEWLRNALAELGHPASARAEELTVEDFQKLYGLYKGSKS